MGGNLLYNRASVMIRIDFSINYIGLIDYSLWENKQKNGQKSYYILIWFCFQMIFYFWSSYLSIHLPTYLKGQNLPLCVPQLLFWEKNQGENLNCYTGKFTSELTHSHVFVYPHPIHWSLLSASDLWHSHYITFILLL